MFYNRGDVLSGQFDHFKLLLHLILKIMLEVVVMGAKVL